MSFTSETPTGRALSTDLHAGKGLLSGPRSGCHRSRAWVPATAPCATDRRPVSASSDAEANGAAWPSPCPLAGGALPALLLLMGWHCARQLHPGPTRNVGLGGLGGDDMNTDPYEGDFRPRGLAPAWFGPEQCSSGGCPAGTGRFQGAEHVCLRRPPAWHRRQCRVETPRLPTRWSLRRVSWFRQQVPWDVGPRPACC